MDRIQRSINNRKQDKISLVNSQPSLRSMRDGEESLHLGRDGILVRYRREKGVLWRSHLSKDGNEYVEKNLKVNGNINLSNKLIINNYPAFKAVATANQSLATGDWRNITLASSEYDNGSNFDLSNEYFVAPVKGIYFFTAQVLYEDSFSEHMDDGERLDIRIYNITDSSPLSNTVHHVKNDYPDDRYVFVHSITQSQLSIGDQIRVDVYNGSGSTINTFVGTQSHNSYFAGHLICAL